MKSKKYPLLIMAFLAILVGVLALGCGSSDSRIVKHDFFRMNTVVTLTIATDRSDDQIKKTWAEIDSFLVYWENHFSQSGAASELAVLNQRASDRVAVDPILGSMIADALAWGDSTGGMYDITEFPLKELWGLADQDTVIDADSSAWPTAVAIDSARACVGYRFVKVVSTKDTVVFLDPRVEIDAGGFAKGYALIRVARLLESCGEMNYLISAGDIIGKGHKPDGKSWTIGIAHPRKEGELLATVVLDSGVIFTSGDYERYRMIGGKRVHHIFNPKTGYSATHNQSVSIGTSDALTAKYLSTGLFGYPADSIMAYAEQRGIECLVVDSAGKIFISRGWKNKVTLLP